RRLARLALRDVYGQAAINAGPRPTRISVDENTERITVEFEGVTGALSSAGRITGFNLHHSSGRVIGAVFRAHVDPNHGNIVFVDYDGRLPDGALLSYGWGTNPNCTLVDAADMAVPAF